MTDRERMEEEGEKISRMAYEAILKRCREGQYKGQPCRGCKSEMAISK